MTNKLVQKADELFQTLVKKFGATSPDVWYNYGHWLHSAQNQPERAHALMARATQALPAKAHLPLMTKFAGLEYKSAHPNPERGHTMFKGLLSSFPNRFDLWNQLLDHEDGPSPNKEAVRDIFESALKSNVKPRQAKKWFKRWGEWEEKHGDRKSRDMVSAKAQGWVKEWEAKKKARGGAEDDEE